MKKDTNENSISLAEVKACKMQWQ